MNLCIDFLVISKSIMKKGSSNINLFGFQVKYNMFLRINIRQTVFFLQKGQMSQRNQSFLNADCNKHKSRY